MYKIIAYLIIIILFLLITFFGLGPVLLADGQPGERVLTLIVVLILYVVLYIIFRKIKGK